MTKRIIKIVILVCVIIIGILLFKNIFLKKEFYHNGNFSNLGLSVDGENCTYFVKYGEGIYSFDGSNEKKISDDINVYSLNLCENKLYYILVSNNNQVVKCLNIANGDNNDIVQISTAIPKIFVNEDNIYYANKGNNGIIKYDIVTNQSENIINEKILDFQVDFSNKKIVFVNNENKICVSNINGKKIKIINDEIKANKIQVVEGNIYFYDINELALLRISESGKYKELISTLVKNEIYNVYDDYVFYYDSDNKTLSKMEIRNSNNCIKIADVKTNKTKINLSNNKIYYIDVITKDNKQVYQTCELDIYNTQNNENN